MGKFLQKRLLLSTFLFFSLGINLSAQPQTPGGVSSSNYTWMAWLTPDSYSSGRWTNLITAKGTVGDFTRPLTPPVKSNIGGYNFHPVVVFNKLTSAVAPNQLLSQGTYDTIRPTENVTMIFVFQRTVSNVNSDFLIGFSNVTYYNSLGWLNTGNNNISATWGNTTNRNILGVTNGILTVSHSNTTGAQALLGTQAYKTGAYQNLAAGHASTQWNGVTNAGNKKIALGGGRNNQDWYGYRGALQEVIIVKKSGNGHINDAELQQIHSYLAIKYGLTLDNSLNYVVAGNTVWDKTNDIDYNNHVFGIAREDIAGLYQ
jgi:hypothetical protein